MFDLMNFKKIAKFKLGLCMHTCDIEHLKFT